MGDTTNCQNTLAQMIRDEDLPPQERGDMLLYTLSEEGLDHRDTVARIIAEADLGRAARDQMESAQRNSLASERFLGTAEPTPGATYAIVTSGSRVIYLPASAEQLAGLQVGEPVLIDLESRRLI